MATSIYCTARHLAAMIYEFMLVWNYYLFVCMHACRVRVFFLSAYVYVGVSMNVVVPVCVPVSRSVYYFLLLLPIFLGSDI